MQDKSISTLAPIDALWNLFEKARALQIVALENKSSFTSNELRLSQHYTGELWNAMAKFSLEHQLSRTRLIAIPTQPQVTNEIDYRNALSIAEKWITEAQVETVGESERNEIPTTQPSQGYLGGDQLADALKVHPSRREALFQQLRRLREKNKLDDSDWIDRGNPPQNAPKYMYRADSLKVQALAAKYKAPKTT